MFNLQFIECTYPLQLIGENDKSSLNRYITGLLNFFSQSVISCILNITGVNYNKNSPEQLYSTLLHIVGTNCRTYLYGATRHTPNTMSKIKQVMEKAPRKRQQTTLSCEFLQLSGQHPQQSHGGQPDCCRQLWTSCNYKRRRPIGTVKTAWAVSTSEPCALHATQHTVLATTAATSRVFPNSYLRKVDINLFCDPWLQWTFCQQFKPCQPKQASHLLQTTNVGFIPMEYQSVMLEVIGCSGMEQTTPCST